MDSAANGPSWLLLGIIGALWTVVLALLAWWANALRSDVRDVKHGQAAHGKTLVRIETALFGVHGDNGINGTVKTLVRKDEEREKADAARLHKDTNRRHAVLARLFRLETHAGLEPMPSQGDA